MAGKPVFLILLAAFIYECSMGQVQTSFGISAGAGFNKPLEARGYTLYSIDVYDERNISQLRGYTSPVPGLNACLKYKLLYTSAGIDFNTISSSYYSFRERGFKKYDANQNFVMYRYYSDQASLTSYSKLNIPIEAGIQILRKYALSPFIFSGINISYILGGNISWHQSEQEIFSQAITTGSGQIDAFDKNDQYNFYGSRIRKQFIFGAGLLVKKHFTVKASIRSKDILTVYAKSGWDYTNMLDNKDYILVLGYNF